MNIDPGELNKRIQIVQKMDGESYDDEGLPVRKERVIRTCWAKVTNTSGTELVRAGSEFAEAKKRFLVRYTPTPITTAMVVRYRSEAGDPPLLDLMSEKVSDSDGGIITTGGRPGDHKILYVNPYGDSREYLEIWTEMERREA